MWFRCQSATSVGVMRDSIACLVAAVLLATADPASACQVASIPSTRELVSRADAIVIAVAGRFIPHQPTTPERPRRPTPQPPLPPPIFRIGSDPGDDVHVPPPGPPADRIQFDVIETLKGRVVGTLMIRGVLSDRDDFNEAGANQNQARPGAGGPCYAYSYRRGAKYLLMLRNTPEALTPYWSPLSRVNDQLRSDDDPWLAWVRRRLRASR